MPKQFPGLCNFATFILEREIVRAAKESGEDAPWTRDSILQRYRFCNVHREDDKVTRWIADNWRNPHRHDDDLWFAMAVARWINWPDTLAAIGYPVPWRPSHVIRALKLRALQRAKVWTGAYMIGTQGNAKDKPLFIVEDVLDPLWKQRAKLRPRAGDTLASFAERVVAVKNQGRFMVGQMIADAKYADPVLKRAADWSTWAISGPGSRRGMNRVVGRDKADAWREQDWKATMDVLRPELLRMLPFELHAQDVQNCLCEFDKYERVRLGEGRPRSTYPGV